MPNYFPHIFIWIDAVFHGLSESEVRILATSYLDRLLFKILKKDKISKTEFFLCKIFGDVVKSDNQESSKQFCRELFSLSFETSRGPNGQSNAEKIEKYKNHRICAKNVYLFDGVVSVRVITLHRLNQKV